MNDETRLNIPDEVSELSVPETRFDRQPNSSHTPPSVKKAKTNNAQVKICERRKCSKISFLY